MPLKAKPKHPERGVLVFTTELKKRKITVLYSQHMDKVHGVGALIIIVTIAIIFYSAQSIITNPVIEPIKIGFIGPLTGDAMSYGRPLSNAVRMAVDVINQSGGVKGRPIEILYEDGKCTNTGALNVVRKLIHIDKVSIIIGGICSGETLAILPFTESKGIIVLSPSSSSPDLTGAGKYFFRNTPSDLKGGEKLAQLITQKYKHTKVALLSGKNRLCPRSCPCI